MKKITRTMLAIGIICSSCSKEPSWMRNYSQPININNPTGNQSGSNIPWHEGMTDEECIAHIKTFGDCCYDPNSPIFLSPIAYDVSMNAHDEIAIPSPNPDYMLFPHTIYSTSKVWSWDYLEEMRELIQQQGDQGMQVFLDRYLQGDSTLGMKLNKNF